MNKPILISSPQGKGMKRSTFGYGD